MSQAACSNNSTDVLLNQSQTDIKIDPHHKVRVQMLVKNQYGEILQECKKNFSPSYFRRGIKKWFWNHGMSGFEIKPDGRPNYVTAVGVFHTY